MTDDTILKQVLKNLGQIVTETGKEAVQQAGQITESVITGKELLGDIKPLSEQELVQKKAEEEKRREEELAHLRQDSGGQRRNVEQEIAEVREKIKKEEDEKEKKLLEELRIQRETEEQERNQMASEMGISSNPAKQKKSRGSAFAGGKKKSHQPDPASMSQTGEIKGKID